MLRSNPIKISCKPSSAKTVTQKTSLAFEQEQTPEYEVGSIPARIDNEVTKINVIKFDKNKSQCGHLSPMRKTLVGFFQFPEPVKEAGDAEENDSLKNTNTK